MSAFSIFRQLPVGRYCGVQLVATAAQPKRYPIFRGTIQLNLLDYYYFYFMVIIICLNHQY